MSCVIEDIDPRGIAYQAGIRSRDVLVSINGAPVLDFVDYEFLSSEDRLDIRILRGGASLEYVVEHPDGEPLRMTISYGGEDKIRRCRNKCVFCFVDQLPKDMRKSLYVKDDDWRMSFALGNYVTLTNADETEFRRILERRVTPLYISVHAADPEIHARLTGVRMDIMDRLRRLRENGQYFHTQAVVCPGLNDGVALARTIDELAALRPNAMTLAVVPVGLTRHREGLYPLSPFNRETARETIGLVERTQEALGGFVYAADELYIKAGLDFSAYERYNFDQLENGVGMVRLFEHEVERTISRLKRRRRKNVSLITGVDAAPVLQKAVDAIRPRGDVRIYPVVNDFFGRGVTVAGLVTGGDIAAQLSGYAHNEAMIPACMLREGMFLDDMSVDELSRRLNTKVTVIGTDGESFVKAVT